MNTLRKVKDIIIPTKLFTCKHDLRDYANNTCELYYSSGDPGIDIIVISKDDLISLEINYIFCNKNIKDIIGKEREKFIFYNEESLITFLTEQIDFLEDVIYSIGRTYELIRDLEGTVKTYAAIREIL